jgi:hypothetical protein
MPLQPHEGHHGYGSDGPIPLEPAFRSGLIPPSDLPQLAGQPAHRLVKPTDFPSGAICDEAEAGYIMFFRVRGYFSLLDHKCLISTNTNPDLSGPIDPNVADLGRKDFIGPPVAKWQIGPVFEQKVLWLVAGLTGTDEWHLDAKTFCTAWELSNGLYYYFGYYDEGVAPVTPPGHFQVELVLAKMFGRFRFTPSKGSTAHRLVR